MKNILTKIAAVATLALACATTNVATAAVYSLVGSGITINPYTTSNFTTQVPLGTFTLNSQYLYLTQNGVSNSAGMKVYGKLTFDGTNFYQIPQFYTNALTVATNSELWQTTNITFTVYGTLSVSNGTASPITNFQASVSN